MSLSCIDDKQIVFLYAICDIFDKYMILQTLTKNGWVISYALLLLFFFEVGSKKIVLEHNTLTQKLSRLEYDKIQALALQDQLLLENASLDDPDFIELILMRELGLIPKGAKKVIVP